MYKILIVEDDQTIAQTVAMHLEKWNYKTKTTEDLKNVLQEFLAFEPELVILDIMLPFFNGFYWCQKIREVSKVPIVFLSSANDNMNIVMAMNMGADEFIEKPFDLTVLTAKVQALLRRTYSFGGTTNAIEYKGALLNLNDAVLTYQEQRVELTKNEFRILQILLENVGKIVSRDTIMERLWENDSFVDDNTLTVNVTRLRKKTGRYRNDRCDPYEKRNWIFGGTMKILRAYIKEHRTQICMYLGAYGIFFVIFDLYHIDLACVEYAFLLSGVWSLLYAVLGFVRYRRTHRELQNVIKGEKEQILEFAEGTTLLEQDYQKLVQKLYTQINETESEQAIERQDMLDYYSMWAHQIKTPIAAMNLLLQTEKEEHPVLVRELEMELFKIQQYVEMVLTYLRMEDMSADLSFAVCDLDTVIRQVVRKYSKMFILKKITLVYEPIQETVLTDEKWLSFVLEQLLSNALQYTENGSVHIYKKGQILVVEDTGIGIREEDLPRIFERGFTGYNGRNDKKSTGIGLYLCKSVMDKLQHGLWLESEAGKGTRACMDLSREKLPVE